MLEELAKERDIDFETVMIAEAQKTEIMNFESEKEAATYRFEVAKKALKVY